MSGALDPAGYPWPEQHVREPVVLSWDRDGHTVRAGRLDVAGLTAVAAVGSNAAPVVLARKLAALGAGRVVLEPRRLVGVRVGHSAHVSVGGYVPAAPWWGTGSAPVVVGWFDAPQLRLLDASEPNYVRRHLDGVELYVSRWGVVADGDGRPLPLLEQRRLLARLRPPPLEPGRDLGDPATAAAVSAWLRTRALPTPWPPPPGGGAGETRPVRVREADL